MPFLGRTEVNPSGFFDSSGAMSLVGPYWSNPYGGLLTDYGFYTYFLEGSGTRSQKFRIIIYNDNGSGTNPGTTLVGVTDEMTVSDVTTMPSWITGSTWTSFGGAPTLAARTKYWIGVWYGTQIGGNRAYLRANFSSNAWNYLSTGLSTPITYSPTANPGSSPSWTTASAGYASIYSNYVSTHATIGHDFNGASPSGFADNNTSGILIAQGPYTVEPLYTYLTGGSSWVRFFCGPGESQKLRMLFLNDNGSLTGPGTTVLAISDEFSCDQVSAPSSSAYMSGSGFTWPAGSSLTANSNVWLGTWFGPQTGGTGFNPWNELSPGYVTADQYYQTITYTSTGIPTIGSWTDTAQKSSYTIWATIDQSPVTVPHPVMAAVNRIALGRW